LNTEFKEKLRRYGEILKGGLRSDFKRELGERSEILNTDLGRKI